MKSHQSVKNMLDSLGERIQEDYNFVQTAVPTKINEALQINISTTPKTLSFNDLKLKFDPKGLEVILRKQVGMGKPIPGLKVDFDIIKGRNSETMGVIVTADPFKGDQLGMLQSVIVEAHLGSASSYFEINEKNNHPITGCIIRIGWKHPSGSNGYALMWVIYDFETKEWITRQA